MKLHGKRKHDAAGTAGNSIHDAAKTVRSSIHDDAKTARNSILGAALDNTSGAVLMETAVSFVLAAMLLCLAAAVLTVGLRCFQRMQAGARAELVSELLLDKISGGIAAAGPGSRASGSNWSFLAGNTEETLSCSEDGPDLPACAWLAFEDRYGIPAAIYAAEGDGSPERGSGYLYIHYFACDGELRCVPEDICWHFDPKVYMGFKISRLLFSRPVPERGNVFRIDLELEHEQTGWKHASYCYIRNMNLPEDEEAVLMGQGEREPETTDEWPVCSPSAAD